MKTLVYIGSAIALLGGTAAIAAQSKRPEPIRPVSQCIDPDRVRGWRELDAFRALVDVGRQHYLIETGVHCPALHGLTLHLRATTYGRICGDTGEYVEVDGVRCPIDRVTLLDADAYDRLNGRRNKAAPAAPAPDARKTVAQASDAN